MGLMFPFQPWHQFGPPASEFPTSRDFRAWTGWPSVAFNCFYLFLFIVSTLVAIVKLKNASKSSAAIAGALKRMFKWIVLQLIGSSLYVFAYVLDSQINANDEQYMQWNQPIITRHAQIWGAVAAGYGQVGAMYFSSSSSSSSSSSTSSSSSSL